MATNEHQTHDLFHPTCERCHEEMFGSVEEVAKEAVCVRTSCGSADGVDPDMMFCASCYDRYLEGTLPYPGREGEEEEFVREWETASEAEAVSRAGLEQEFEDSLSEATYLAHEAAVQADPSTNLDN